MAGKFIRGALIQFANAFLVPVPNVIVFQYNPEQLVHTLTQATSTENTNAPLAVKGPPGETFTFTLQLHANDQIAKGNVLAVTTGIYARIAALETLMHPAGDDVPPDGSKIPQLELPTVLFVWGPARILPVRVTSLSFTETLYDPLLNPVYAEAAITLTVLTPSELETSTDDLAEICRAAYAYTNAARKGFAIANLANAAESVIGMIPV
jgi:hypothetical protein